MNTDIQIYGQLGLEAPKDTAESDQQPSETNEQLIPHYVVQQQTYPKTGETNQFLFTFLGLLVIILVIGLKRRLEE